MYKYGALVCPSLGAAVGGALALLAATREEEVRAGSGFTLPCGSILAPVPVPVLVPSKFEVKGSVSRQVRPMLLYIIRKVSL